MNFLIGGREHRFKRPFCRFTQLADFVLIRHMIEHYMHMSKNR